MDYIIGILGGFPLFTEICATSILPLAAVPSSAVWYIWSETKQLWRTLRGVVWPGEFVWRWKPLYRWHDWSCNDNVWFQHLNQNENSDGNDTFIRDSPHSEKMETFKSHLVRPVFKLAFSNETGEGGNVKYIGKFRIGFHALVGFPTFLVRFLNCVILKPFLRLNSVNSN